MLPRGGGPLGEAPINVSKGCAITYSAFAMHRRKDLFGEDAAQFCPERWLHSRFGWVGARLVAFPPFFYNFANVDSDN